MAPSSASQIDTGQIDTAQRLGIARKLKGSSLKTAAQLQAALEFQNSERVLALGISALDEVLPQRGLVQGSVIELQVHGASGAATSFALCACRAAQRAAHLTRQPLGSRNLNAHPAEVESRRPWCAFIDPSASLFAPGIARLGVELDRLLVVRPGIDAVDRVSVRIAESKAISLLVVDLRGALGDLRVSSHRWSRTVRRLTLAVKQLATCVLLITSAEPRQALPLPVAMRLEFTRASAESFEVRVGKELGGRVSGPREVPWSAFDEVWQ
jgi:hypothetical protein